MGYTTEFTGRFDFDRPLDDSTFAFLVKFNQTRRVKRRFKDDKYGVDGEFFVLGLGDFGQAEDPSVVDYNSPPSTQPGLWCQWQPVRGEDGEPDYIEWDGGEKFYEYVEWLEYLIKSVLAPKGYVLNGEVKWQGEDMDDRGLITVKCNRVTTRQLE